MPQANCRSLGAEAPRDDKGCSFTECYDFGWKRNVASSGLLQRFFDFYSVVFGITAPPPAKQKLVLAVLVVFVAVLVVMLVVVGKFVSTL